jgi:CRISPR-associated protein Csx17
VPEPLPLPGIRSSTLLGYLKGLGVLSILGRQDDRNTAGFWSRSRFVLYSSHDMSSLEAFFLDRWEPAPVVSPWNGGSGFFNKDNTEGFDAIEASSDPRLRSMKRAIGVARTVIQSLGLSSKPDVKAEKPTLLRALRAQLPDDALEWLDAAVVLVGGEPRYAPVLGSGGNDGRYDIANNYAQCLVHALGLGDTGDRTSTLRAALAGTTATLRGMSLAHLTRDASPVNSPSGEADALGNPWDLVLAVAGALTCGAGATRRLGATVTGAIAVPFTLHATGAGYGSAVGGEKGRDELWMPTWTRPARLGEVRLMLREGRVQVGRRSAVTGLDAARAVASLGVARGVSGFERFVILERAGQSNLSVPAGRIEVRVNPASEALATLDPWLERMLQRRLTDIPAAQRAATLKLERSAFAFAEDGSPANALELLSAVGALELACTVSRVERLRPLHAKAGPWLRVIQARSDAETRLAVALASLAEEGERVQALRGPLIGNGHAYAPLDGWLAPREAPIVAQLAAIHERCALEGHATIRYGLPASLNDLEQLCHGRVDEAQLGRLLRGLVVLDWQEVCAECHAHQPVCVNPLLALLALGFHDPRQGHELRIMPRPDWVSRLRAGRVLGVVTEVHLRLRLGGLAPIATVADLTSSATRLDGPHLAAALLARPSRSELFGVIRSMTIDDDRKEHSDQ